MSDSAPRLTIRLLGAPEIRVAGLPLVLNHLKARALPFYLAATGQSHTRDLLTTLLWSESPPAGARHSLRSGIYRLRQALTTAGRTPSCPGAGALANIRADAGLATLAPASASAKATLSSSALVASVCR